MSMRKWQRKMAHEKADMFGIKRQNKPRWFKGKKLPSWFATNWEKVAATPLPKPRKEKA